MFTFDSKTTVIFGQDTVGEFGTQAAKLDAKKALLVTDKGIIQAGLVEKVNQSLTAAGINVAVFDEIDPNPTDKMILRCAA